TGRWIFDVIRLEKVVSVVKVVVVEIFNF
ncbi:MAG: hypothetical protein JWR09_5419, partial [Mucilaginibacter sp.]|nr:hypothetical protein [Mucilaginibacter sp.]